MKRRTKLLCIGIMVVCVAGAYAVRKKAEAVKIPPVPAGHPRVYLRPADIPILKEKIKLPEFSKYWEQILSDDGDEVNCALVYLLTGDKKKGRDAIEKAYAYVKSTQSTGRAEALHPAAMVYDWCYDLLTAKEKADFIKEFKRVADIYGPGGYQRGQYHALVGHYTEGWLQRGKIQAGAAIYDEDPAMYNEAAQFFFSKFVPARNFVYKAHRHHQGDSYIVPRFGPDIWGAWFFRRMGAGDVFSPEMRYVPYQLVYNLRPDKKQMTSGDSYDKLGRGSDKFMLPFMVGSYYEDPYLLGLADSDVYNFGRGWQKPFMEIVFGVPGAKRAPLDGLPLTKYFPSPMGEMVARTGWSLDENSNDAVAVMRIGEYFFGNHMKKDFGTFQLYYKGGLALASGGYKGYFTEHWKNYYHQTISQNGLLIFDPREIMRVDNNLFNVGTRDLKEPLTVAAYIVANDGGQRWPNNGDDHPRDIEMLTTKGYKLGSVTAHAFGPDATVPDYSYISGDITEAYSADKAYMVTRSMVAFNTHDKTYPCAMVVYDRMEATDPAFKKTWLLHSIQEPQIKGRTVTVVNDGQHYDGSGNYSGKLSVESLLPEQETITKVGGPGKEYWVESTSTNYVYDGAGDDARWSTMASTRAARYRAENTAQEKAAEYCSWRIEISPSMKSAQDRFLNVLTVMDKATAAAPAVRKVSGTGLAGAQVLDRTVLFGVSPDPLEKAEFSLSGKPGKALVCDLSPGKWDVSVDGKSMGRYDVTEDAKALYIDVRQGKYTLRKVE